MSFKCKGTCEGIKKTESQQIKGYAFGQRYCSTCCYYICTEIALCPCCHNTLRRKARKTRNLIRSFG